MDSRPTTARPRGALAPVLTALAIGLCTSSSRPAEFPRPAALRLGVLFWHSSPNDTLALLGIRDAFATAGIEAEWFVRQADEDPTKVVQFLDEFRNLPVDLLFALGTEAALRAGNAELEFPVVFTAVTHPVESGVTEDWAPTGRNFTGNSNWIDPAVVAEVFQLAVPGLHDLGMLRSVESGRVSAAELSGMKEFLATDDSPRIRIHERVVADAAQLPTAVAELLASGVQAIWIPIDFTVYSNLEPVLEAVGTAGIPLVSSSYKAHDSAVAAVFVDYELLGRRAGALARRILSGEIQAERAPIERLQSVQVVVNLEAAGRCGFEIPLSLLALADEILGEAAESDDGRAPEEGP